MPTYYILGGGGGEGGQLPIYDIVRICGANSPLFLRCQVYDKPHFGSGLLDTRISKIYQ